MSSRQQAEHKPTITIDVDKIHRALTYILIIVSLYALTVLALYDRLLNLFYFGWHLAAYDPFIRYYLAKFLVESGIGNGLAWWITGGLAHYIPQSVISKFSIKIVNGYTIFTKFWYPWGIDWARVLSPGVSLIGALAYIIIGRSLGLTLLQTDIVIPCIINALAVLSVAYLTWRICPKEIRRWCALIAAAWVAISTLYVVRSYAGWFDDVPMYEFFAPLGMALFFESYLRSGWQRPIFVALSLLVNGFTVWIWGGYYYLFNIYGIGVIVASLYALYRDPTRVDPGKLLITYVPTYIGFATFILLTPRYGVHTLFSGKGFLPLIGLILVIFVYLTYRFFNKYIDTIRRVFKYIVAIGVIVLFIGFILSSLGITKIGPLKVSGRYLAILAPPLRKALVSSVAEHQYVPANTVMPMFSYGVVLAMISIVLFIVEPSLISIIMLIGTLFGMYFLASMYYTAFSVCMVMIPVSVYSLTLPLRLGDTKLGTILLIILGAVLGAAIATTVVIPLAMPTLLQGDWIPALEWLQFKTKPNATVVSWWDYGYLISVVANRTSLADNSTVNGTQIATIARLFLTNIYDYEKVYKYLKMLGDPQYMLVYQPFTVLTVATKSGTYCIGIPLIGGDFDKSIWMARIGGYRDTYTFTHFICRFTKVKKPLGPYVYTQIIPNMYVITYGNGKKAGRYLSVPCSINYTIYYAMFNPYVISLSYQCLGYFLMVYPYWIFQLKKPITGYAYMLGPVEIEYSGHLVNVPRPPGWLTIAYVPRSAVYIYKINYAFLKHVLKNVTRTRT